MTVYIYLNTLVFLAEGLPRPQERSLQHNQLHFTINYTSFIISFIIDYPYIITPTTTQLS
jgi:hypothetical protein